jgi:ubiquinone/menaquinone biosynthesis C-methylase UbiE
MVNNKYHNELTKCFYQSTEVANEYEEIRFMSKSGIASDILQKNSIYALTNRDEVDGALLLDVGCGTGRFSRFFSDKGAYVVGVDASIAMLDIARNKSTHSEIYLNTDALLLPFLDNSFDIAISVNLLNHLANYEQAIGEMCRVARKVILGVPNRHSILLLAYIYRFIRGYNSEYGGYTVKEYKNLPVPYSIYFSESQLKRVLQNNGMKDISVSSCLFTFFLPNFSTSLFQKIDNLLSLSFGKWGAFIAISGEKSP